jgi:hypothetical protein
VPGARKVQRMLRTLRTPSPALVISLIALFVSLAGTAVAQTPVVQRALFAENASKLKGKTLRQVTRTPGPASTADALVFARTSTRILQRGQETDVSASCGPGATAISGGFFTEGGIAARDSRPSTENTWTFLAVNLGEAAAEVTVQAICLR